MDLLQMEKSVDLDVNIDKQEVSLFLKADYALR